MSIYSIYKIENKINGKVYVGKSNNPLKRFKEHLWASQRGCNYHLHRAIRKYGKESFTQTVIESNENEDFIYDREKFWIERLESLSPKGYNFSSGGKGGMTGIKFSDKHKIKISESKKGTNLKQQTKDKIASTLRGKKRTKDIKDKISKSSSSKWKICFKSGKSLIIVNMRRWCKENGYNSGGMSSLYKGRLKKYKDIISVVKI